MKQKMSRASGAGCAADAFMNVLGQNCYGSNKIIKIPLVKYRGTMLLLKQLHDWRSAACCSGDTHRECRIVKADRLGTVYFWCLGGFLF